MIDLVEYAQLSVTAGVAKRVAVKAHRNSKWLACLKRHRTLKTLLAGKFRQVLPAAEFVAALGKSEPTSHVAKQAHQLLNYDPSEFLDREYPTRESLIFAVYSAHSLERKSQHKLEALYNAVISTIKT